MIKYFFSATFFLLLHCISSLHASIVIIGTRHIYLSNQDFISVDLKNVGNAPSLVQSWVDSKDTIADPTTTTAPFIITPPITKIDADKGQSLRIIFNKTQSLALDRETLFWLNILDIPAKPKTEQNYLQFAIRNRIKLFFRPNNLPISQQQAFENLKVAQINKTTLTINNSSPYYINFAKSHVIDSKNLTKEIPEILMMDPFSEIKVNIDVANKIQSVELSIITDYGNITKVKKSL
jgi:chaperone protein EcpD